VKKPCDQTSHFVILNSGHVSDSRRYRPFWPKTGARTRKKLQKTPKSWLSAYFQRCGFYTGCGRLAEAGNLRANQRVGALCGHISIP